MGLLSDPESGKFRFGGFFIRHHLVLCYLLYVGGFVWMAALCYAPFNAGTYFSENALLPGLVEPTYREEQFSRAVLKRLVDAAQECSLTSSASNNDEALMTTRGGITTKGGCDTFLEALASEFRSVGLEVHSQRFNYTHPLMGTTKYGTNLYAIMRAPRHASTESVVFSTSYTSDPSAESKSLSSLALLVGLAKRFRHSTYWAKDWIFLASDGGEIGTQAWLEGYHEISCGKGGFLNAEPLNGHAGAIQAALNFEFPSIPFNYVDVKVEGLNGQLPNLDLVTMVHKLFSREGVKHTHHRSHGYHPNMASYDGYLSSAKTLASMMTKGMGLGLPTGNHGLFLRFAIPAVTLRGHSSRKAHTLTGYTDLGRAVEGMARCLNNLLERFHQSFFFYLLPASHRYISIGLYFGPFAALAAPLVLRALAVWLSLPFKREGGGGEGEKEEKGDGDGEEKAEESIETEAEKGEAEENLKKEVEKEKQYLLLEEDEGGPEVDYSVMAVLRPTLVCHAYGLALAVSPSFLVDKGVRLGFRPSEAVLLGFLSYGVMLVSSPVLQRWITEGSQPVKRSRYMMVFVALLELALVLFTLALYNIACAFILATIIVPFALAIGPRKKWKNLSRLIVLLLNPVTIMLLASAADILATSSTKTLASLGFFSSDFWALVYRNLETTVARVLSSTYLYGHWLFYVVSLTLLPCWVLLWHSQFD